MLDSVKVVNCSISVVIPALNAEDYLPGLLEKIESQTLLPKEIVIVDSSLSKKTADIIEKWKGSIPIIYQRVDFAYPGHARNIGVGLAKEEWIAFIDCRMIPDCNWLELIASTAEKSGAKFVGALRKSDFADSHFKKVLCAATYGFGATRTLAGSIVLKRTFEESGGFISDIRAGEDLEWIHRLKLLGFKISWMTAPSITYSGFVESLSAAVKKWFVYAFANSSIEIKNIQKAIYLPLLLLIIFFFYRWNAIFAAWDITSIYYLPNVTKIFILVVFTAYVFYRGIVRPLKLEVKLSFLLPWRWLMVSFVGLCLDLAKTPGISWGAIVFLYRRICSINGDVRVRKRLDIKKSKDKSKSTTVE
jgi:glycosyltransferase involved in cell wall biosynthesis